MKEISNQQLINMTKETFLGYLRSAMAIVGSLVIGRVIFGTPITTDVIDGLIGGGLFVASTIWGIRDKTATLEMVTSALFKVISLAGGIAVAKGLITGATLTAVLGLVPLLAGEIIKKVDSQKEKDIASGKLGIKDLKAAQEIKDSGKLISPVINTPKN